VVEFRYTGTEDGSEKVVYRLERGGFRAITGAIGRTHKENYLIETPIAHMGVRGTDHESYYFPPGASGNPAAGVYNKVNVGAAYIRTEAGEVVVRPGQAGYAASAQDAPRLLAEIPGFFNRAAPPRPAQVNPGAVRVASAPLEQIVSTATGGPNLSDPSAAGAPLPGTGSVVGYIGGNSGRSSVNPVISPNGAMLVEAGSDAAFGVNWGAWQGGAPTVDGAPATGRVHFAGSTQLTTAAQLAALPPALVSATYNYMGGPAPANQAGTTGSISALSVAVNFSTQTVSNYSVAANAGGASWTASGSGSLAQFTGGSGIALSGQCAGCTPGSGTPTAQGSAHGSFVGPAAERMLTSFGLKAANQAISGAAVLSR
jgi:hypothetical protein